MLCDLPCRILREDVIIALDSEGFANKYDFVHVPGSTTNLGYAFINFVDSEAAESFRTQFTGYRFPGTKSAKVCSVKAASIQGLEQQMRRSKAWSPGLESNSLTATSLERAATRAKVKNVRKKDPNRLQLGLSLGPIAPPPIAVLNPAYLAYNAMMWHAWMPFAYHL
jgi:hypothetical protein